MSNYDAFSARKPLLVAAVLLAQAFACSGGNDFTATTTPDASVAEDSGDNINIVANPNDDANAHDAGTSPTGVDATAGLPSIDASGPEGGSADVEVGDAGVMDAGGPDALVCPSMELACDGGCLANDVQNCGACGKTCAAPSNGAAACNASAGSYACGISCNPSYTHCATSCVDLQTDAKNCGSCGHDCLAGTCSAGKCQPWVVAADNGALRVGLQAGLVVDTKYAVWVSAVGIKESPVQGGNPINLIPQTSQRIYNLAMSSGIVAWTIGDTNGGIDVQTATEGVMNVAATNVQVPNSDSCTPRGLALTSDGRTAYFILDCSSAASLCECDLTSLQCTNVAAAAPTASGLGDYGNDVAFANGFVFWTDSAGGYVSRYSTALKKTDSNINVLFPVRLATDSSYVYWATGSSNGTFAVSRAPQTNLQGEAIVVAPLAGSLAAVAVDGIDVYLACSRETDGGGVDELDYVPAAGGANPLALAASGTDTHLGVAVAGGAVYWLSLTNATGNVALYGQRFP